jgi:hypothetical protein
MRALLLALAFGLAVLAQSPNSTLPTPRLVSLFPCGAKSDSTVTVIVQGTDLDDATRLLTGHPGITAILAIDSPPKSESSSKDKDKAKPKAGSTTTARFTVTVKGDVPPGQYDVRVVGRHGVSNPRSFTVGKRPEAVEINPNNDVPEAQRIRIGEVINGVIDSNQDVDYYSVSAKQGQRLLVHCAASSIDSRARPLVEIYAPDGKTRLGLNRNWHGNDALADVDIPADGDYLLRISEFAYVNGGPEYFYRVAVEAGPWVDAVYPPMIDPSQSMPLTLIGRNLSVTEPVGKIQGRPVGVARITRAATPNLDRKAFTGPMTLPQQFGLADGVMEAFPNPRPLVFATAPIVLETSANNDTPESAQAVTTPCEIAGTIMIRNDRDHYRFPAKRGEPIMIEVQADRIGSNIDLYCKLLGPDGREIVSDTTLDDDPESIHPTSFFSRSTDPAPFKFLPPSDGTFTLMVATRDGVANYGPRSLYRVRIAPPRPDFRVVLMPRHRDLPSSVVVRPGGESAIDAFIQRIDGFNGPVTITLANLPQGVSASPILIGPTQRFGMFILKAGKDLADGEAIITGQATAMIDGKTVTRTVRTASIVSGVPGSPGSPTIARLDQFMPVATRSGPGMLFRLVAKTDTLTIKESAGTERSAGATIRVKAGDKITVPIAIEWLAEGTRPNLVAVGIELTKFEPNLNPFESNNGQMLNIPKEKNDATLSVTVRQNTPPGQYRMVIRGDTKAQMAMSPTAKEKKEYTVLAFAEPLLVTVLPSTFGKLTASEATIKLGQTGTLLVKVDRAFDFAGPFPISVTLPPNSGLVIKDAIIPAGASEVSIPIALDKDARAREISGIVVKSAVPFDRETTVLHETRATITIRK